MPAGVRLEFDDDGQRLSPGTSTPRGMWNVWWTVSLMKPVAHGSGHQPGEGGKRVRIWLPQSCHVRLGSFQADAALKRRCPKALVGWAYGSSITQCRLAAGPSETWPALVATRLGWSCGVWGSPANATLDPAVPGNPGHRADVISLWRRP